MSDSDLVLLVHGSNAHAWWRRIVNRGYAWWRRWSLFSCALRENLGGECEIREFRWTGRDHHQALLDAAEALAGTIECVSPGRKVHVVGHSHGGNVALAAAARLDSRRLDTLVLLGTPHLELMRKGEVQRLYAPDGLEAHARAVWNIYSSTDRIQGVLARWFHGVAGASAMNLRLQRTLNDKAARNLAIPWERPGGSHHALHSGAMGAAVGALLRGASAPEAFAAAGLSLETPNPAPDRGGWPGLDAIQRLIQVRGSAAPFAMGDPGADVGILLVHGFTASPSEVRPLGEALMRRGRWRCRALLLPGHGTRVEDMQQARGPDWIDAVDRAYAELAAECRHVFLCGVSLGAVLSCHTALRRRSDIRLRGLLLIAPAFGVTLKKEIGLLLSRPFRTLRNKGTRAADYFLDHRLNAYVQMPLNLAAEVLRLAREAVRGLGQLQGLPVLLFAGDLEKTVSLEKIHAAAAAHPWIQVVRLPKSRHILTVEPDRERLFEISARFVEDCVRAAERGSS